MNHGSIALLHELSDGNETEQMPIVIIGCIGPWGTGYKADAQMTPIDAEQHHGPQAQVFPDAGADLISAFTMTYSAEAIGIVWAARAVQMPVVMSFTVETDGRLPSGETIGEAINAVDAATDSAPAYYMINRAHPSHFAGALGRQNAGVQRIRGIRANASRKSHVELDRATELDIGNPEELGMLYRTLRRDFSHFSILGGCCGTDHRHIKAICTAGVPAASGNN